MESEDYWFMFLCSLLMIFLILFLILGMFENPEMSNFMESFLIGVLVIITCYYAFTVRKQTRISQEQHERDIRREFSSTILLGLRQQLVLNIKFFREACFMYSQAKESAKDKNWLETKRLGEFSQLKGTHIMEDFYKKNAETGKEIEKYELRVAKFVDNYTEYMRKLFSVIEERDLLRRVSSGFHEHNVVFPWIAKKLLMPEDQFKNQNNVDRFIENIWNPNKNELEECLKPLEKKGKEIGYDRLELAELSEQLLKKLT